MFLSLDSCIAVELDVKTLTVKFSHIKTFLGSFWLKDKNLTCILTSDLL